MTAFDRNFDYFVGVKKSRGIFNTNLYWDATRAVLDKTGKLPIHYTTNPQSCRTWRRSSRASRHSTSVAPRAGSCRTGRA